MTTTSPELRPVSAKTNSASATAVAGALLLAVGVGLGAFGAHSLKEILSPERLATFETGVRYQLFHGLGLLLLAAMNRTGLGAPRAAAAIVLGVIIFSGSLYLLVAGAPSWFGLVAPIGGALMISGWVLAAWRFLRP